MRNQSSIILTGTADGDITGAVALDTNQVLNITFQITVTGGTTTEGTFQVQGSNDLPTNNQRAGFAPTNWSNIPNASSTMAAGVAPMIVLSNVACQFMRVIFTRTAGVVTEVVKVRANSVGV